MDFADMQPFCCGFLPSDLARAEELAGAWTVQTHMRPLSRGRCSRMRLMGPMKHMGHMRLVEPDP